MPNLGENIDVYMAALMALERFSGALLVAKGGKVMVSGGLSRLAAILAAVPLVLSYAAGGALVCYRRELAFD